MSDNKEMVTIGRCKDCKWRNDTEECTNDEKIHEDDYRRLVDKDDHFIYSYNEDGHFWVGPDFGCIHWVRK